MEIKFLNQPKDVKIGEILTEKLMNEKFVRVWIFAGFVKDSGLDYLLEAIKKARENGTIVECILGLDKKNTSKDMLSKLLNLGCKIRFHMNDDASKLETRIYAFESDIEESYLYLTGAKLSEGGLTENISLVTEIKYLLTEKREFNKVKLSIESGINNDNFQTLNEELLKDLASTGEILARITERKIPSISELYNAGEIEVGVQEYDENTSAKYAELANTEFNIDIDIDLPQKMDVKVQNSLGEEVEHKIKSNVEKESKSTVISKLLLNENNVNYDTMNTLILAINKVPQKGVTAGEIRVSSAISIHMNKFFNYPNRFHVEQDEKGKIKEKQKIKLEIFENLSKSNLYDEEAVIIQTEKSTIIKSRKFVDLDINENDIMRLIKQNDGEYRCEIIKQESSEYNVWENFCTIAVRGTSKKFGII